MKEDVKTETDAPLAVDLQRGVINPKRYNVIYADPPWKYGSERPCHQTSSKHNRGGATKHYNSMSLDDICGLPITEIAADDCVLFMWATFPKLFDSNKVMEAWGFEYKTCAFVWVKANKRVKKDMFGYVPFDPFMGMGRWTRSNVEICLLATKGKPQRINAGTRQVIYSPVMRHSQKPIEVANRIVSLCGDVPRVELFARGEKAGWDAWGNEIVSDIALDL